MKIYLFDSWRVKRTGKSKFNEPLMAHWRDLGHEVKTGIWWGADLVEWADVCYFYPVENNLKQASLRQRPKPAGLRVVAEAVDADVYGGHWRGVDWDWVDHLVCMAEHIAAFMRPGLPDSLPVTIVPGGVDLDRWMLRRRPRGYNVAWVGRYWIAKNLFGALQIFNQLIKADPSHPWRLHVRGEGWSPDWWREHCLAYVRDNPELERRTTFVEQHVPDLDAWLEDKDFLLQTSFKEAFGYCVAEAAAKGIRPVVQNTNGARAVWGDRWVFDTHDEAVRMLLEDYDPGLVREAVATRYPLERRLRALDEICFGE